MQAGEPAATVAPLGDAAGNVLSEVVGFNPLFQEVRIGRVTGAGLWPGMRGALSRYLFHVG
jgi:hypothetical protein